jgi:hypothetical protein
MTIEEKIDAENNIFSNKKRTESKSKTFNSGIDVLTLFDWLKRRDFDTFHHNGYFKLKHKYSVTITKISEE